MATIFFFFVGCAPGFQGLSSLSRDWIWATAVKEPSPNHCTGRGFSKMATTLKKKIFDSLSG